VNAITGRLGIATSICAAEIRGTAEEIGRLSEEDLVSSYLALLDDFARFAAENGFSCVEIEFGFSAISARRLLPYAGQIRDTIRPFDTVSCHLPLGEVNISALNPEMRLAAIEETKRHIDLCAELGIRRLVMHPGSFAGMPDRYSLLADHTRRTAMDSVLDLQACCQQRGMGLSLENLHCHEPLFRRPDEFTPFVEVGLGIVLDTLHAASSGVDPLDFIATLGSHITEVHLTDGVGGDPLSDCAVGAGTVDCLGVLRRLDEVGFDGPVILEVLSEEALIESRAFLHKHGYLA
jgi:sugar phosphate isomerase/epimerase